MVDEFPSPKSKLKSVIVPVPIDELFVKFTNNGWQPEIGSATISIIGKGAIEKLREMESLQPKPEVATNFKEYSAGAFKNLDTTEPDVTVPSSYVQSSLVTLPLETVEPDVNVVLSPKHVSLYVKLGTGLGYTSTSTIFDPGHPVELVTFKRNEFVPTVVVGIDGF